ncbi:MAG: hypothetical protein LRZ84_14355 [Desertifilum sp.]|nr:hypothetical protein [Desertifilum sp.]
MSDLNVKELLGNLNPDLEIDKSKIEFAMKFIEDHADEIREGLEKLQKEQSND